MGLDIRVRAYRCCYACNSILSIELRGTLPAKEGWCFCVADPVLFFGFDLQLPEKNEDILSAI